MKQDKPKNFQSKHNKAKRKTPRKITADYLHNSGLYYLERFSSCSENFRRVMRRKISKSCYAHPDQDENKCHEMLEELIIKFERLDLLNDRTYARAQITTLRRRGKSTRYIQNHLTGKGLSADHISAALFHYAEEHSDDQGDETAALTFARKKKIGPYRGSKEKNAQKELSSLARAGFSYDIARKIIELDSDEETLHSFSSC